MRAERIIVDLVDYISINECVVTKTVNNHAKAKIVGTIGTDDNILTKITDKTWASIKILDDVNEKILFTGLVEEISLDDTIGNRKCELTLIGATVLLDIEPQTKTFQNSGMTFVSLFEKILSRHKCGFIFKSSNSQTLGEYFVQYKETDWEFVLRMASCMNACIIPEMTKTKPGIYVGLGKMGSLVNADKKNCILKKEINCLRSYGGQMIRNTEIDDVVIWTTDEVYELGNPVNINGGEYYIYSAKSSWDKSVLVNEYELRRKCDFEVKKHYNFRIVGASLDAKIIAISGSKVKVKVTVDGTQSESEAKLFNYSTVFSSPDGTGWYCMPEIGDDVRVYFPSEKEDDAYVISSVHIGEGQAARTNPDIKTIMNRFNKQILWDDKSIVITNNNGTKFELNDQDGIIMETDKSIKLEAKEDISITSLTKGIEMVASENIIISEPQATITMSDGTINIDAGEVHIQK